MPIIGIKRECIIVYLPTKTEVAKTIPMSSFNHAFGTCTKFINLTKFPPFRYLRRL